MAEETFEIMYYANYGGGLCLPEDIVKKYNRKCTWDIRTSDRTDLNMIADMKKHQETCNLPHRCDCKIEYVRRRMKHKEGCPGECSCSDIKYESVDISYKEGQCWKIREYDGLEHVELLKDKRDLLLIKNKKNKQKAQVTTLKKHILDICDKIMPQTYGTPSNDVYHYINLGYYLGQLAQIENLEQWQDVELNYENMRKLIEQIKNT